MISIFGYLFGLLLVGVIVHFVYFSRQIILTPKNQFGTGITGKPFTFIALIVFSSFLAFLCLTYTCFRQTDWTVVDKNEYEIVQTDEGSHLIWGSNHRFYDGRVISSDEVLVERYAVNVLGDKVIRQKKFVKQ